MPVGEVLRIAAACAEQLRVAHHQRQVHGALTPSSIRLTGSGVELEPAAPSLTPYTAPEILEGRAADERTDIFSFGAILFEMFTGRCAFEGADDTSLAAAILGGAPRLSGVAAVDAVVAGCLAHSPDARFQSMQKLQLELRLLAATARRGGLAAAANPQPPAPPAPVETAPKPAPPMPAALPLPPPLPPLPAFSAASSAPQPAEPAPLLFGQPGPQTLAATPLTFTQPAPPPAASAPLRDMEALEARIAARLEEQEKTVARVESVANEVLKALRGGGFSAPQPQPRPAYRALEFDGPAGASHMDRAFELLNDKVARIDLTVGKAVERLQKLEDQLEAFDTDCAALRDSVTRDIRNFERALKAQANAIESARTAMGQTDDLVERVVEALDSLQSMFMTPAEERAAS